MYLSESAAAWFGKKKTVGILCGFEGICMVLEGFVVEISLVFIEKALFAGFLGKNASSWQCLLGRF